jgi:hypothetical protein
MTTATQTAAAAATQADGAPGRCRYPGCASPARGKDPAAPGPRPGYCEQEVPEDRGDGKIVVAGLAGNGSNYDFALARYNADGILDTSFDGDGLVITSITLLSGKRMFWFLGMASGLAGLAVVDAELGMSP